MTLEIKARQDEPISDQEMFDLAEEFKIQLSRADWDAKIGPVVRNKNEQVLSIGCNKRSGMEESASETDEG